MIPRGATYGAAMAAGRALLQAADVQMAALDTRLLAAAAANLDTAELIGRAGDVVPPECVERLDGFLARRAAGEPVARILAAKEFWGRAFRVSTATLVPRPDTEILVEAVLEAVPDRRAALRICDLGTGTGAILVALLCELPGSGGWGVDICAEAVRVARANAEALGVGDRAVFYEAGFHEAGFHEAGLRGAGLRGAGLQAGSGGPFDIVVSNPPYIRSGDIADLPAEVRDHDPRQALDGGPDGLDAYRCILDRLPAILAPRALVAFEVGRGQAGAVLEMCANAGIGALGVRRDLAGIDRVVHGWWDPPRPLDGQRKKRLEKSALPDSVATRTEG